MKVVNLFDFRNMNRNKIHRQIWIEANGPIPIDKHGRSYEIHHINKNPSDNRLENLLCVSIDEHFRIHLENGDLLAAAAIAKRIGVSVNDMRKLNSAAGKQAFLQRKGIHAIPHEQRRQNSSKGGRAHKDKRWFHNGKISKRFIKNPGKDWQQGRLVKGTGFPKGTKLGSFWNDGTRNIRSSTPPGPGWVPGRYLNPDQRRSRRSSVMTGKIQSQETRDKKSKALIGIIRPKYICPHCGHIGRGGAMSRWHFDSCKERK